MSGVRTYRSKANGRYTTGYCSPLLACRVTTCVAAASVSSRRIRSVVISAPCVGPPAAQPVGQRGQAEALLQRGGVQRLADVPQVGELPFAVDPAQHPGRQVLLGGRPPRAARRRRGR